MIQVALCEQALIQTNRKRIQNHQSRTVLLFIMTTLEFKFKRHLDHMGSYQGMQSGLPVFLVGEFGAFKIFIQNDCFAKPDFSYFQLKPSQIDHIWKEYDHILPFTNHKSTLLQFWFIYKA